jgi:hypothetical protein
MRAVEPTGHIAVVKAVASEYLASPLSGVLTRESLIAMSSKRSVSPSVTLLNWSGASRNMTIKTREIQSWRVKYKARRFYRKTWYLQLALEHIELKIYRFAIEILGIV